MKNFLPSPTERKQMVFEMLQPRLRPGVDCREVHHQMDEIFAMSEEFLEGVKGVIAKFEKDGDLPAEMRKPLRTGLFSEAQIRYLDSLWHPAPAKQQIEDLRYMFICKVLEAIESKWQEIAVIKNDTERFLKNDIDRFLKRAVQIFEGLIFAHHSKPPRQ